MDNNDKMNVLYVWILHFALHFIDFVYIHANVLRAHITHVVQWASALIYAHLNFVKVQSDEHTRTHTHAFRRKQNEPFKRAIYACHSMRFHICM